MCVNDINFKIALSAIILCRNEQKNIENCLKSIKDLCNEIIIVDSFSRDSTLEIVKKYTNIVYQHNYESHPQQWIWILNNINTKNEWIFALDADFVVTEKLKHILRRIPFTSDHRVDGYYVRHKQIFRGRWIKYGGCYPAYWLRIFKRSKVKVDEEELVDVHFYIEGITEKLECDIIEDNKNEYNISFWIYKQNRFSSRYAREEIAYRKKGKIFLTKPNLFGMPNQRILFLKMIWYKLPLYLRPFLYFFYRYFIRLGFLDGKQGFIYHFLQGFWYRFLVDIKIDKIESGAVGQH